MVDQANAAGQRHNRESKAAQTKVEQHTLDVMYAHLDTDLAARSTAMERAIAKPIDSPADAYARDLEVHRLAEQVRHLRAAEHSLCFGRIDRADGEESLHIGRIGMRTEAGEVLLVDWRAEAARAFYAATPAHPMGVRKRRHLRVQHRSVVDVTDELLDGCSPLDDDVVGDGPLVAALSGARTGRMREAASTLQAEQDEIVRSPHRGVMVVHGGPGTGKTIVALHRAAYVLYAWPSIAGRGVLVYGPNRRFLTYISEVLPSLGENDVQLATLSDLAGADAQRTEPDHLARLKGRAEFADALATWVRTHEPHGVPLELRTAHDTVVLDATVVDAARRGALQGGIGHNAARVLFIETIVDDLVNELEARAMQEETEFEGALEAIGINLDRAVAGDLNRLGSADASSVTSDNTIDWGRIREDLLDDPSIERAVDRVWPPLTAEEVVRGFLGDSTAVAEVLPEASEVSKVSMADIALICDGAHTGWTRADLALVDEAQALVEGPPEEVCGHVVVDEAQQLSPMQWRVLMRRCPERSMTVVGDLAQAGPTTTIRTWDGALNPFVQGRFARHTLTINYRTTAEILEATRPLLAKIAPDQQLSRSIRHGEPPTVVKAEPADLEATLRALVAEMQTVHPGELIGVITTAAAAPAVETALNSTDATVIAAPDARGLEFDTAIIVDPTAVESACDAGLRDLYVAQTRATQRLISLEPPRMVPAGRPRTS